MGNNIRIGKDFNVQWAINKVVDGECLPYDLVGKELQLYIVNDNGRKEVAGWKVQGNVIEWTFLGKDQKRLGAYQLVLVENAGKEGMVTVDTCKAFNLVEHSCEENVDGGNDIVIKTVTLESEVALAPVVLEVGEPYDDTEIKEDIAELQAENERLKERIEEQDQFIEDLQNTKIEKENDDYYPKMAVGLADNLAGVDVVDSEINFRRSGGGAITDGVARIESIKGNSVVWNQVFKPNINAYGSQFVKTEDDNLTIEVTKEPSEKFVSIYDLYMGKASHKYFVAFDVVSGSYTEGETRMEIFNNVLQPNAPRIVSLSEEKKIGVALRAVGCIGMRFRVRTIDLTQMFNSGNEPTTIEEFYARIPMGVDMNAYNEGEVIHMDVQSIESVGVNQWDEEWELGSISTNTGANVTKNDIIRTKNFIPVIEGGKYYYKCPSSGTALSFCYDDKYNVVEKYLSSNRTGLASTLYNAEFTVPQGVHYIKFYVVNTYGTTYKGDICISLSDASINGKYYPYIKRVEDLSIIRKYFPQGMKSAGSAHDAIRYNKESNKWENVEAIGTRAYQEGDADNASYLTDGKVTCYPLSDPIITELDKEDQLKDLDYAVWNAGTEKALAEGKSAPLAADITYGFNAIGKIKELESLVVALRAKVGI